MELSSALDRLADDLTQQYKVVYGRPGSLVPPKKIDISGQAPGRGDACDTGSTEVWSVTCDGFYLGF